MNQFIGTWVGPDEYTAEVAYTVSEYQCGISVTAVDPSDGEFAEVSDVRLSGQKLSFTALWPSTGRRSLCELEIQENEEILLTFTYTDHARLVRKNARTPAAAAELRRQASDIPLHAFEGFIDKIERSSRGLIVRLLEGGFDPSPASLPARLVTLEEPEDLEAVVSKLNRIKDADDGVYVWIASDTRLGIQPDHGDELTIDAKHVLAVEGGFELRDYERLARLNHGWGQSQRLALSKQTARLQRVQEILRDQHDRVARKAEGHAVGSTARTLYDQQLALIARLLAETEA